MNESNFLNDNQEQILRAHGYVPTLLGETLEVWKVNGDVCMIDIGKDEKGVWCKMWVTSEDVKCFSPKRMKSFFDKNGM